MNLHLVIISFVEGLTEFLPVSSTAHLILFSKILALDTTDQYIKFYLLFVQFGALLAGSLIFAKKIFTDRKLFINICISFLPSAAIGFVLYKLFKHLLEGNLILIALTLFVGGLLLIYLEKTYMKKDNFGKDEISKMDALVIGLAQALAIVPGVSRAGATITAGIFRGIKKEVIFEYTFILALPTIAAAVLYDAYKSREILSMTSSFSELFIGLGISFVVAAITLYILRKHLKDLTLSFFGWYRIILAIIIILFIV